MIEKQFTILALDDSPEDQETYRRFLRDQTDSYDLHAAYYAAEGLKFCETQWPDLIILDFLMPDLNGIQFIDALQEDAKGRALPAILALTGQGNEEVAVTLMKKGVQDYLIKSKLTKRNFQLTVQRILEQVQLKQSLKIQQQWQKVLSEVALRIRKSLKLVDVLNTSVQEVKQFLNCDRVVVYQFDKDWSGNVVAEAVDPPWKRSLGIQIIDTCFQETKGQLYRQGRQKVIEDIYQAGLSECYISLLEEFQVQAALVIPILLTPDNADELPRLWGLLIAHQCQNTRKWVSGSILFLDQLSVQLAIAIQQAELLQRLNQELAQRAQVEQNLRIQTQEQERLIQDLAKATILLEQRNQDLDSFVSIASHDLRSPLRAIGNLATWLSEDLEGVLAPDSQQQFELLRSRVQHMETLLNDLLQYARIGRVEDSTTNVFVADLLNEIISGLEIPPNFAIQIAPDMPNLVTRRTALEQVFTNLISNAIKHHTREDGRVEIAANMEGEVYRFDVVDDGPGIASEYHQSIFEVFRTLTNISGANSTGIGLAVVKKLVELQGGTITLESEVGRGTAFRFTWPL
jgi:light-regulated signal transduction histidine kinase (bacteriophytochrome)